MFVISRFGTLLAGSRHSLGLLLLAGIASVALSTGCVEVSSSPIDPPEVDFPLKMSSAAEDPKLSRRSSRNQRGK